MKFRDLLLTNQISLFQAVVGDDAFLWFDVTLFLFLLGIE